jgi:isovaleryl-CoA dehydrogenase
MTAELVFENVFFPADNVGDVNGATICMMRNLEIERVALLPWDRCSSVRRRNEKVCLERQAFGS